VIISSYSFTANPLFGRTVKVAVPPTTKFVVESAPTSKLTAVGCVSVIGSLPVLAIVTVRAAGGVLPSVIGANGGNAEALISKTLSLETINSAVNVPITRPGIIASYKVITS
jgi:hypothetical protein